MAIIVYGTGNHKYISANPVRSGVTMKVYMRSSNKIADREIMQ